MAQGRTTDRQAGCQCGRMPCPLLLPQSPFEPFTLLFHLVIVILLLLLLLLPPMVLLLLHLCAALCSLFICNLVFFKFVFLILNFALCVFPRGKFMLHNAWTCKFTCVGPQALLSTSHPDSHTHIVCLLPLHCLLLSKFS